MYAYYFPVKNTFMLPFYKNIYQDRSLESNQQTQILLNAFTSLFSRNFIFSVCTELPLLYDLYFYVDNSAITHV